MKAPWNFMRYFPLAQRLIRMGKIPALLLAVARKSSSKRGLMKGLGEDLGLFLLMFGVVDPEYGDLNGDGVVDGADYGLMLILMQADCS